MLLLKFIEPYIPGELEYPIVSSRDFIGDTGAGSLMIGFSPTGLGSGSGAFQSSATGGGTTAAGTRARE
jgi:hypothetical protein